MYLCSSVAVSEYQSPPFLLHHPLRVSTVVLFRHLVIVAAPVGLPRSPSLLAIPDSQTYDKSSRPNLELPCNGQLVNWIKMNINLFFITAGNASIVWEPPAPYSRGQVSFREWGKDVIDY